MEEADEPVEAQPKSLPVKASTKVEELAEQEAEEDVDDRPASPKLREKVAAMMQDLSPELFDAPTSSSSSSSVSSSPSSLPPNDLELQALLEEEEELSKAPASDPLPPPILKTRAPPSEDSEEEGGKGGAASKDLQFPILFEDKYLLAAAKPPGCGVAPSQGAKGMEAQAMLPQLKATHGPNLFPVASLDHQASGLVLFAKNQKLLNTLMHDLETGDLTMNFTAWVEGRLIKTHGQINIPLQPGRKAKMRPAEGWVQGPDEKLRDGPMIRKDAPVHQLVNAVKKKEKFPAITKFSLSRVFELPPLKKSADPTTITRVLLQPLTLRQHQLRVHMRAVDMPLVVDKLYGLQDSLAAGALGKGSPALDSLPLHLMSMTFTHPQTGERTKISCPLSSCNMNLKRLDNWLAENAKAPPKP